VVLLFLQSHYAATQQTARRDSLWNTGKGEKKRYPSISFQKSKTIAVLQTA